MRIGNVEIKNKVFLAPMAGVTDLPFRVLCKEQGCGLVYTEMVSAKGIMYNNENTHNLLKVHENEHPVSLQIFGSVPKILAETVSKINYINIDIIDINMGCPAPKIFKNGEGSALMMQPSLIGKIVKAVSSQTNKPITVKIRKGVDEKNTNAVEVAKIAEENGAAAIAVHGRNREQYYSGKADWEIIKKVKESVSIPVIGNGDIVDSDSAKKMLEETGCDAIMIGRASMGNPWIFKEIVTFLEKGEIVPPPSLDEKIETAIRHAQMLIDFKGEYIGVREMRKHLAWYTKGMKDSAKLRVEINKVETLHEIKILLQNIE